MLRVVHSTFECEVAASPSELAGIAAALRSVAETGDSKVVICDTRCDRGSWPTILSAVRLERSEALDRVAILDGILVLSGTHEGLERLASFFEFPDHSPDGVHVHHEATYSSRFTNPNSFPLIVCVRR
jgi:hypothetical protein